MGYRILGFKLLLIIFFFSCSSNQSNENSRCFFSTVEEGRHAISKDNMEDFFETINAIDISLQLKRDINVSLDSARKEYISQLGKSVIPFTLKDTRLLLPMINSFEEMIQDFNPKLFPDSIRLIKIKPDLYGEGVFYTREHSIIIPSDMLEAYEADVLFQIILHEIFHIYSRLNKDEKRKELYELIGYHPLGLPLNIPDTLNEQILLNPDGLEKEWYIQTIIEDEPIKLIPLLHYVPSTDSEVYFDNFQLRFFKVFENGEEASIQSDEYVLKEDIPDFYEQIGDNTDYIIHPDEVLADNFVLAMYSLESSNVLNGLSPKGKELVKNMLEILKD